MIGYDIGARIDLGDASNGLETGVDAPRSESRNIIDRVDAAMGLMPEMVTGGAGHVSDPAAALNGAAEAANRIQLDVASPSSTASDSDDGSDGIIGPRYRQGDVRASSDDGASAIIAAQVAGSTITDAGRDAVLSPYDRPVLQSGLDDGVSWPIVAATVKADPQVQDDSESERQFGSILYAREFESQSERNPGGLISNGDGEKNYGWYTGMASANKDSSALESAAMEMAPIYGNGRLFGADTFGIDQIPSREGKLFNDRIEGPTYPFAKEFSLDGHPREDSEGDVDLAFGSLNEAPYWPADLENSDELGNSIPPEGGLDRILSKQTHTGMYPDYTEAANSIAVGSTKGKIAGDTRISRAAFWEMLKNAERILPRPGHSVDEDKDNAGEDVIGGNASGPRDGLAKIPVNGFFSGPDKGENAPAGNVAPAAGRSGPSGHKNDPIYTVAISPIGGTLMPMVPTPGTSTRSPPMPGQRNLP